MKELHAVVITLASLVLIVTGCPQPAQETAEAWTVVEEGDMTPGQLAQQKKALAARDAMFATLKGRLMDVMGSEGPAATISVCSKEAPEIAEQVSQAHGLKIGRTSFHLRNPDNTPPTWATQLVADRVAQPTFLTQEGKLAALLPIHIGAPCLICHGPEDTIPSPVKQALSEHYPNDQATGFQAGDLRGWFRVEVPAADGS